MTKTIIMIHGMWGSSWYWENYKRFFEAKGYQCITPTLRFHDMAPEELPDPQLGTTSLLDYVGDLEKGIHQLDAPPILMGHSMGGLLAQWHYRPEPIDDKKLLEWTCKMGLLGRVKMKQHSRATPGSITTVRSFVLTTGWTSCTVALSP